jgi:hypothetical protein
MEVKLCYVRRTSRGYVVADLVVLSGVEVVKFHLHMRREVLLRFNTTNRSRAELAVRLLKEAGVSARVHHRKVWYVFASIRRLASAKEPLKEAVVASIKYAAERGWIDEKKAQRWIAKIAGLPTYNIDKMAVYSKRPEVLEREVQRLREVGLAEKKHFTVRRPEGGRNGYVKILREGLAHIAWLSAHGSGRQRELAGVLLEHILRSAQEKGEDVYRRVKRTADVGISRSPPTLIGFEREVGGRVVKVKEALAWLKDGRLKIAVAAEVDGVEMRFEISFIKMKKGGVWGFVRAKTAEDAERIATVIRALTDVSPTVVRTNKGVYILRCNEKHLKALIRYTELADAKKWIED